MHGRSASLQPNAAHAAAPSAEHGTSPASFDFSRHMRRLIADIAARVPEMAHIEPARVAIAVCQVRKRTPYGLQAAVTPMRFAGGSRYTVRGNRRYTVERLFDLAGREMLYVVSFYLPRFLDVDYREKLVTVFHELWHISPHFNGDLRRHDGRCYLHTRSERAYDAAMAQLADRWLATDPPPDVDEFLRSNFRRLRRRHGAVVGTRIRTPRLIPVDDGAGETKPSPA